MGNARCGWGTTWLALAYVGAWMAGTPTAAAQPVQAIAPADSALVRRLDSLVIAGMASERLVGATLALVRDGTLVMRGYGFVHRDRRAPVDPDHTLFGISSISKTFTAAALLQLAERGRLSLDDPVAPLAPGVALREYDGRAVRVRDLLTHTGGFDDVNIGVAARTSAAVVPLGRYLATEMPAQVRAPGSVTSYSNHGYALAGLAVERASGVPFARYLRDSVLDPLGMRRSGFEQPLPDDLEAARARPYSAVGSEWREVPRIYFNDAPASAMYTTAADMSRFMRLLLDGEPAGVLGPPSIAAMLRPQFTNHPAVTGLTFGMRERRDGGITSYEQGGDWQDYSSDLIVSPAARTAMFVAFSGEGGDVIAESLWQAIVAADPTRAVASADSAQPGAPVAAMPAPDALPGRYRSNRYSRRSMSRLGVLTGAIPELEVTAREGAIALSGGRLQPVDENVFRRDDTGTLVAFRRDGSGEGTHLFLERSPYAAYERVPWYDAPRLHLALFAAVIAALVSGLAVAALSRRRATHTRSRAWRTMAISVLALELAALTLLVGIAAVMATTDTWEFQYGVPPVLRWLVRLSPVAIVLAAVAVVSSALVVSRREGSARRRGVYVMRAIAGVTLVALLWYWRVLP